MPAMLEEKRMDRQPTPSIRSIDRLDDGVIITFDDDHTAFYPAALLFSFRDQARAIPSGSTDSLDGLLPR